MRRSPLRPDSSFKVACAAALFAVLGCSKERPPTPARPEVKVGAVTAKLSSPSTCPATGTCTLYPDMDTTVKQGGTADFGKGHELCAGLNNSGGLVRTLLHFDLGQLPAKFYATSATLTITGRRPPSGTGGLNLYVLTGGTWSEGSGTNPADGFAKGACPSGVTCVGACGWAGTGTNNADFSVTANVGAPSATVSFSGPSTVTFGSTPTETAQLAADVRGQASGTNFGWVIRSTNEAAYPPFLFLSTDTGQGDATKPGLAITYSKGPGSSCTTNSECRFASGAVGQCAGNFCCSAACNDDGNQCTNEVCSNTGACSHPIRGGACDDSNACTTGETCQGGACTGGTVMTCAAADQCHTQATCAGGSCPPNPAKTNGTTCNDSDACTTGETCQSGACTGGTATTCTALNQCHTAGTCDPSTGACSNPNKANGTSCEDGNSCTTGDTCQNGSCTPGTGTQCPAADQCHIQASCSGGSCPANPIKSNGTACEDGNPCTTGDTCQSGVCTAGAGMQCPTADQCHIQASCSGGSCPANPIKTNGTACSDNDPCTTGEACQNGSCIGGTPKACPATDQCHNPGTCSGGNCSNPIKTNGTPCDDGNSCTSGETCQAGACTGGTGTTCTALDQCHVAGTCSGGNCSNPNQANGTPCNDNNVCTTGETCQAGSCTGGTATPCTALDQCHDVGTCTNGACSNPAKTNGTACNDGNACTTGETCQAGSCTGGTASPCTALDQCHVAGTCNPATGACSNPTKTDGSPCSDGNACTQVDTCQAGSCAGSSPVVCPAPDQCHTAGSCNTATGVCSNPNKANGTGCNDGKACTTPDTCTNGACGGPARVCDDGIACTVDGCSETAGGCTVNTSSCGCTSNANCNDGNACNGVETCNLTTLTCVSGTPVDCSSLGNACNTGTCNPTTGACSATPKPNGTTCNDGNACTQSDTCQAGACQGASPVVCTASNQCHTAGTCNPTTGACSDPNIANGTACDDGNSCTSGEACQNGSCTGGTGTTCQALDQCHVVGACSNGVCSNPIKTNGTACDDRNACTAGETCQNGACTGGTVTQCTALDQCHSAGVCSQSTGACSNPNKANGTVCDDGKFCTTPDTCTNGVCGGPARLCNDGIACTTDGCSDTTAQCTSDPSACGCRSNADCDDSNACNGVETCDLSIFACKPGTAVSCTSKDDACNVGTCNPANGTCSAVPKTNGTVCDDGNACTRSDSCQAGKCAGNSPVVCTALDQCHAAGTCNTGTGICSNPTVANGAPCNDGNACTSGDSCNGGACKSGAAIDCTDTNPCTADACDTAVGCIHPAGNSGAACGSPASCTGGKGTLASSCNGASTACPANVVRDCAPYACGASACLTTCSRDADCAEGNYCAAGGKCTAKVNPGVSCTSNNQCLSSFCVDGVCCNDDCTGQCEACNVTGKVGTCSPVNGKPVAPRAVCVGNGTGCDGSCDGVKRTACAVPGQSTQCRAPSCTAAVATLAEFCDGSGACPVKRTQDCKPGICGVSQCTGCSTNATCPANNYCRGGVCKPLAGTGTACSIDAECTSGHCVDGVCCNADCTGQCEACNQPDHAGECTPIAAGGVPAQGRPGCAGGDSECGGKCDGQTTRSCVYPGPGVSCRAAKCENGLATLVAFCDGAGHCPADDQQTCPAGYTCENDLCAGGPNACVADSQCNADQFCSGGVCQGKNGAGTACNTSAECASGICVDGRCCTDRCTGQCEACNVPGNEGTCVPVVGAPVGSRQACASDGTECGGSCDGSVGDRCTYKGAGTSCRAGTCKNGLAELAAFCQGNGTCAPRQQQSCDPVACDTAGVQCTGPCKANTDCKTNEFCAAGMCVAKQENGVTCGAPSHCASGHCVDGLCCDTACDGQCASCDQVGHLGTCVAVTGAPRDGRPSCQGGGACGGFCDGNSATACSLPGANQVCGQAFCANAFATGTPACNGAATCIIPPETSCDPYQCDDDKVSCRSGCRDDADCTGGLVCDPVQGGCVQPVPDGGSIVPDASTPGAGGRSGADAAKPGDGGSTGSGGTGGGGQGTGGRMGTGATTSIDGGVTAGRDAGQNNGPDAGKAESGSSSSGSCGCRVPGSQSRDSRGALTLGALLLLAAGRRRRAARPTAGR